MKYLLLTQEKHDYLVKELGFDKVNTRCPVCYTEQLIVLRLKEVISSLTLTGYRGNPEGYINAKDLFKELGLED